MKTKAINSKNSRFLRWARHVTAYDSQVFSRHVQSRKADVAVLKKAADQNFRNLTASEGLKLEAIVATTGRPVFLVREAAVVMDGPVGEWNSRLNDAKEVIAAVLPSVGRIEMRGAALNLGATEFSDQMIGTGFVVAPNVILTNRHVAEVFCREDGSVRTDLGARIDFVEEHQRDPDEEFRIIRALEIGTDYDYAILEVGGGPSFPRPLALGSADPDDAPLVFAVGYPAFDSRNPTTVQQTIFGNLFEVKRLAPGRLRRTVQSDGQTAMEGDYTTLGGNSGSPLLDFDSGEVLGLHFAGAYLEGNYSVPMQILSPRIEAAVRRMQSERGTAAIKTDESKIPDLVRRIAKLEALLADRPQPRPFAREAALERLDGDSLARRAEVSSPRRAGAGEPAPLSNAMAARLIRQLLADRYEGGDIDAVSRTTPLSNYGLDAASKRQWQGPIEDAFEIYGTIVDSDRLAASQQVEGFITAAYRGSPNRI